ncbi:MAG: site-specific DNA-methyltransferase [Sphingobacteriaceae bacterium]|nr:site-specific DNA-methyltransferase [Cytophagaceae bacterium]
MTTTHRIFFEPAQRTAALADASVHLVVTSPPYPMIEMWDESLANQNSLIRAALERFDGPAAFEAMHAELDRVWEEVCRVTALGGLVCINIGDGTRTLGGTFQLFPNHARILSFFQKKGFSCLPAVLWRKPTNTPNKFMGSGMLPAGAYVTLEHEYILIFRNGGKRVFTTEAEKQCRQESAFFWEERNAWFSDLWDVRGTRQGLADGSTRDRSGAFPFEIPYRLINMYSVKGDTVLDPFLGTGTTALAALVAGRNSVGYEREASLSEAIFNTLDAKPEVLNQVVTDRLERHWAFLEKRTAAGAAPCKHFNPQHQFPVMTSQEKSLRLDFVTRLERTGLVVTAHYAAEPVVAAPATRLVKQPVLAF